MATDKPPTSAQTALVTGASVGIGLELAKLLAADRYKLVLVARDAARLATVAGELRQLGAPAVQVTAKDLSKPQACEQIAGELAAGGIDVDILINNAGFGVQGQFWKADLQKQRDLLQVNITALTHLTHLLLPGMIARRRGKVMNVASVAGFVPGPFMACYFASKAYVLSFSLALSEETRDTGVTVTAVCPGATKTEFFVRAGIDDSRMAGGGMTAQAVARIGYQGMLRGKPLVVTGLANKLTAQATRLVPKMLLARIAGGRNKRRGD